MEVMLGALIGGLLAVGSTYLAERRRDKREREAWARARQAEREDWERARAVEREDRKRESHRAVIEQLQEIAYDYCQAVAAEAAERVQRGGDVSAERYAELSSLNRRAVVLLNRVENDDLGRQLDDFFASRWITVLMKTPHEAIEGTTAVFALWESLNERLRREWVASA